MANVSMDLEELKALENKIKKLESENDELISKQQQIVVSHKHFNSSIKINNFFGLKDILGEIAKDRHDRHGV